MSSSEDALFLGLDASTQSLKASLLSVHLDVLSECSIHFDTDLPEFNTKGGVTFGPDKGMVSSPAMMLVCAVDKLFEKINKLGWEVGKIRGVAAAGQQHASVYWSRESSEILSSISPSEPLSSQLSGAFSRSIIPNWQDSSTSQECSLLESAVGGAEALASITGSRAYERFTASQIMRFRRVDPEAYEKTDRISLVSSAVTTLLCLDGEVKGIDESDACGMNLWTMNTPQRGWNQTILKAIAGEEQGGKDELERKLGKVEIDTGRVVGSIGDWFVGRYGFNKECKVFPGTGDNPATFLSLNLRENEGMLSLGTSDVVLVSTSAYRPHSEYHAFFHPAQSGTSVESGEGLKYFNMIVYKNGSLARQHVRDTYFQKSWEAFNAAVEDLRPKSGEVEVQIPKTAAFWWLLPDIVPHDAHGVYKYLIESTGNTNLDLKTVDTIASSAQRVEDFKDVREEAVSILESQLLNYHSRSSSILDLPSSSADEGDGGLTRVYATGGASANSTLLSLMADIFNTPICKLAELPDGSRKWKDADWNACSVGVAYKARWGWERTLSTSKDNQGQEKSFDEVVSECRERRRLRREGPTATATAKEQEDDEEEQEEGVRIVAVPGPGSEAYKGIVKDWWIAMEKRALSDQREQEQENQD